MYKISSFVDIQGTSDEDELEKIKDLLAKFSELLVNEGYGKENIEDEDNLKSFIAINYLDSNANVWVSEEIQNAFIVLMPVKEGDESSV